MAKYPHQPLDGRALTVMSDQLSGGLSSFLSKRIRMVLLVDSLSLVKGSCWLTGERRMQQRLFSKIHRVGRFVEGRVWS